MGLDTTHNCWHGPYSSFNRFRYLLAAQIGVDLNEYKGYSNYGGTKELASIQHDIQPLLNHSDCDGKLTVKESKQIANGLDEILKNLNGEIPSGFKEKIVQFRDGCLDAIKKNEAIEFH